MVVGAIAMMAFAATARFAPLSVGWGHGLLVMAALVLFPLALELTAERRDTGKVARSMQLARQLQLPAALMLAFSFVLRPGWWAMLAALPWAVVTLVLGMAGLGRMLRDLWARPLDRLSADVGMGYAFIGAGWILAERAGIRPLGFDSDVLTLTAVHFHYAGFLLLLIAGLVLRQMPDSRFASRATVGVILGVPALAAGVTIAQLGWTSALEAAAGGAVALYGMAIGVLSIRWSLDAADAPTAARVLVAISGICLFFAMVLAGAYAIRAYVTAIGWLDLPRLQVIQGTLNAVGFALCGLLGWGYARAAQSAER